MDGGGSAFEDRGIIPRAIEQIFSHIRATVSPQKRFLVRASYLQIYNDIISDLLMPERTNLNIREESSKDNTSKKTVFVEVSQGEKCMLFSCKSIFEGFERMCCEVATRNLSTYENRCKRKSYWADHA